jgi:CDP-glucose 4,6-dehydratase
MRAKRNLKYWSKRRVLVTGASGFIGSAVVQELLRRGAFVYAIVKKNDVRAKRLKQWDKKDRLRVLVCDLRNAQRVKRNLFAAKADTIFHFAGFAIVNQALARPVDTYCDNFFTTLNLLEAARLQKVHRIIIASSDKVYGDHAYQEPEPLPYAEDYGLRGLDIYSSSKACSDIVSQAYAFQYNIKVGIARSCNIYGPGDLNFSRLIPRTVMLLLLGKPPIVKLGHERVLREYLYIDDAVRAYLLLAESLDGYYGKNFKNMPKKGLATIGWPAFNIGSYSGAQLQNLNNCDNIKSVTQVIRIIRRMVSDIKPRVVAKPPEFIEIPDEYLDSTRLAELGFRPQVNFGTGIKKAIYWYKSILPWLKKSKNYDVFF